MIQQNQILFSKNGTIRLFALFLCLNLCHCFLLPKLKIKSALSSKNCSKLSGPLIYDLSIEEIEVSVSLCLQKKEYQKALVLLKNLETKNIKLKQKMKIWKQKAHIYSERMFFYSKAIVELEKILSYQPEDYAALYHLLQVQIKKEFFDKALKTVSLLLKIENLESKKSLEIQFIKARLLVLSRRRKPALDLFGEIKKKHPHFFKKMQGGFYTALLLEEEERFDEAIEELQSIHWPFSEAKNRHWRHRKKHSAISEHL